MPSNDGASSGQPAADNYPSTMPQAGHNWQITLSGKVIASES